MLFGISLINVFLWLMFGAAVGASVYLIDTDKIKGGVFTTVFLGMLGSVLGGAIAASIINQPLITINFMGILTAVIVGLLVAVAARIFLKERGQIPSMTSHFGKQ